MKNLFSPFYVGLLCSCVHLQVHAQEFKEHITKEIVLSKEAGNTTLLIYNVSGFVKVEGYAGNKVILEIDKTISSDDKESLEIGKKEFKLGLDQSPDSITAYIAEPYDSRPHNHRYDRYNNRDIQYEYHLDFTVKVPFAVNLNVSTVNDGDVVVKDVTGALYVDNVNGAIAITNAKGATHAHTVNGNVEISYLSNPLGHSSYYTVNGEIKVIYAANLSADLQFKSLNGEFFTDFPNAEVLPAKATKNKETKGGVTIYKLDKITSVRIGTGGNDLKFETLNGNIYIKKQS